MLIHVIKTLLRTVHTAIAKRNDVKIAKDFPADAKMMGRSFDSIRRYQRVRRFIYNVNPRMLKIKKCEVKSLRLRFK